MSSKNREKQKDSAFKKINNLKEVVTTVMKANGSVVECDNSEKKREFLRYFCPKKGCLKSEHATNSVGLLLEKNRGYTNAFKHLTVCFGSADKVWELYQEGKMKTEDSGGSINAYFQNFSANDAERDICTFIEGVVLKNWALSDCEDNWIRRKLRFSHNFAAKRVKEILHKLVEVVEEKIRKELKLAKKFYTARWLEQSKSSLCWTICVLQCTTDNYFEGTASER